MKTLVLGTLLTCCCVGFAKAQMFEGGTFNPAAPGVYEWSTGPDANDAYFFLTLDRTTWTGAEAEAEAFGGHLASITSPEEQAFLENTFLAPGDPTATVPLWIGLEAQIPGDLDSYTTWTDGQPVTYTNYNPGEPNDLNGDEAYVAINWHYSFGSSDTPGTWNDLPNGGSTEDYGGDNSRALGPYYGIVEVEVPEPGSAWLLLPGLLAGGAWFRRRSRVTVSE